MEENITKIIDELGTLNDVLLEIKDQFIDLITVVEKFADAFNVSKEIEASKSVIQNFISIAIEGFSILLDNIGPLLKSFSDWVVSSKSVAAVTKLLTNSIAVIPIGLVLLLGSILVLFVAWDDLNGAMKTAVIALGFLGLAIIAIGLAVNAALAPYIAFFAALAVIVAVIALIVAGLKALNETDTQKKVRADTEAIKEQTKAVKEQAEAYGEVKEKRKDAGMEAMAEYELNQKNWAELQELNAMGEKTAEQKSRMAFLTDQLNESLGTEIQLTNDGNSLVPGTIENINDQIEATRAQALAEVVVAQYKEALTEAFKNANEIRALEAEKAILIAKSETDVLSYEEKQKLKAIGDNLDERYELKDKYSTDIANLEEMQVMASEGRNDELLNTFMVNTQMGTEVANQYAYDRQEIDGMMYDGLSEQGAEALGTALETIQQNGMDINQFLDENGKLRKDINLDMLEKINADLLNKQEEAGTISQKGGENSADNYTNAYANATEENQPIIAASVNQTLDTQENTLGLNEDVSALGQMADRLADDFNGNIINNVPETQSAMAQMSDKVARAFDGKDLPELKGRFYDEKISSALGKVAGLFGFSATPRLSIIKAASGGFLDPGQLFLAREAGPELIGRIGAHTAVMNNDQIVSSVRQGVFEAVSAAMAGGSNAYTFCITNELDGSAIGKQVVKYHNGIVKQTGVSPLLV